MQINSAIPFHIAQAYSMSRPQPAAAPAAGVSLTSSTSPIGRIAPTSSVRSVDAAQDLSSISGVQRPRHIDRIIGGTVHRPIAFDGAATRESSGSVLQLYTRAADKIDAAVAVNVGRAMDIMG